MDQVARLDRQRQVDRRRVDAERTVRQVARERRVGVLALPHRRQVRQRLAVAVDLRVLRGRRVRDAVRAGKQAVEVVEAAVLGVDHDDVLDAVERPRARDRRRGAAAPRARARSTARCVRRTSCDSCSLHWRSGRSSRRRCIAFRCSLRRAARARARCPRARAAPSSATVAPASARTIHSSFMRSSVTL